MTRAKKRPGIAAAGAAGASPGRVTSARIDEDLDRFRAAGGRIEVLEATRARDASDTGIVLHEPQPPPRLPRRKDPG